MILKKTILVLFSLAVFTVVNAWAETLAVDLSKYVRVGRYNLPEYRRTALPAGTPTSNLLCDEASGVAYNWDTDTLFICGDGGRAITQVTKTGQLVDTMTLELNASKPQGTEFYDPEGITYIGGGQFVFSEERERQLVRFTYVPGTTLTRASAQTVDLGTFDDNTGTEGLSWDPQTSGFIVLKEKNPIGVFQTGIDWNAGTATNGSSTTVNSTNLFNTTLLGMTDVADVFALSNLPSMTGQPQVGNLLILGQENARVVNVDRNGNILSTLNITSDVGNPLSAADQQPEGITMDRSGNIYIVNENGGGSIEYPQLWVYAPSTLPNQAPTSLVLNNEVNSIQENTSTLSPIKLGDIIVIDDGLGTNTLSLSGADAASFQITNSSLFIKPGVILDFETKASYSVTINVDDSTIGTTPDATLNYTLTVTDQVVETPLPPVLIVTEVAPWSSGNAVIGADWFEVTNVGSAAVDITSWRVDDNSASFAAAVALNGITTIAPGESVIFLESSASNPPATVIANFLSVWFGGTPPVGLQVGTYQGSGIGLGTSGDGVNLFTAAGTLHSGITFGAADSVSPLQTFDNTAAANNTAVSLLSQVGVNGAFTATNTTEVGSPGFSAPGVLRVTEVAPWSSGNSPVAADWFEVTNTGARTMNITGWKVDDSSESPAAALPLTGITSIAPGESVIFIETANLTTTKATFLSNWFGASPPATLQVGAYSGAGIGLSTGGDAVNLYDTNNVRQANVSFGIAPSSAPFTTFDNASALNVAALTQFSVVGVNGAFVATNSANEIGSPGARVSAPIGASSVSIAAASITEGNSGTSILNLPVTRTNTASVFTVSYAVTGGTATAGTDYATLAAGTLSFTFNGAATQNIAITVNGDTTIESNETVTVTLSGVVDANGTTTIGNASASGTITNDDTVPVSFPANARITSTVKGVIDLDAAPLTGGAEIPAFDPISKRAFTSSNTGIQVIDLTNPATPTFISTIVPATLGVIGLTSNDVSSVTIRKGSGSNTSVLAAAIISVPKTAPGYVVFLNAATGALIGSTAVGANPDHIAFTPDGSKLLVANEGELDGTAASIPDSALGTISIISVNAAGLPTGSTTADFTVFDSQTAALRTAGVRIFQGGVPSTDFEPEYFAISADSTKAMVTLQEANAVAVLDIPTSTFTSVMPLGKKNFATGRYDFSDRDGVTSAGAATTLINPTSGNPVFGLYMPDAIASYSAADQTYYVTSNEGDDRNDFLNPDETTTVGNSGYVLDPTVFPNATALKNQASLGRLTVSNAPGLRGDIDNDGDIDEILSYGGRSFSILDSTGNIIFDSGDMIENIIASQFPANFDDLRSDNKGPEPEGVTIATLGARTYAFVGLERSHMTLMFDVTNPAAVTFTGGLARTGDLNPEGLVVVSAADSPSGKPLLLVASEVSQTLTVFELNQTTDYTMQLLHFADAEAGLLASQTAPNLAALVDAFDGTYANTLILAGGDNYIPGPFAAAGTDALVAATHNKGNNPFAADIEIHNRIGVEASTVGNHEFDFGTNAFSDAVADTNFPYLTSNLNFAGDSGISARYQETVGVGGLEEASSVKNKIVPSCVVTKGTEKIGLVGVTTQILEAISSTGGVEVKGFVGDGSEIDNMVLLASQVQPVINDLKSQGVNKIILMAHLQQIANELILAPLLTDVDIILAAGSNTRLGDGNDLAVAFTGHAANFAGNYPIYTAGADGKPTVVVNTDNEFTYLGRLVADFDADGILIVPNLLTNTGINGAYAATAANVAAAWNTTEANLSTTAFAAGTKGALVKQITDAVQGVINAKDGDVRGYTNVYLEGERNFVRNQETNLGNISADSMVTVGKAALPSAAHVVALKNGGGIRAAIGAVEVGSGAKLPPLANPGAGKPSGAVSLLDIENSMRFNNGLMLCETTPAGLKAILEHGVALLGNQGRFPQIGGMRFSFDSSMSAGSRVRSLALTDLDGNVTEHLVENGSVLPNAPVSITLVTLNFLANNGDSYPFKANADNFRYMLSSGGLSGSTDESLNFTAAGVVPGNILGEQVALSRHLQARHATPSTAYTVAETPIPEDTRIQQLSSRVDTVLAAGPVTLAAALHNVQIGASLVPIVVSRIGTAAASVRLVTANGTVSSVPPIAAALAGVDYTAVDTVVSFAQGELSKTVNIPLLTRSALTPNRRFNIVLSQPSLGSTLGAITTAEVRLLASDSLAPTLAVITPTAATTVVSSTSPYMVRGTVSDLRGVDRVEVSVNGAAAVSAQLGTPIRTTIPWSLAISPVSGSNTLSVIAYDLSGNATTAITRSFSFNQRYNLAISRSGPVGVALDGLGAVAIAATPASAAAAPAPVTANANPRTSAIEPGTAVKLTATPRLGYLFSHWAGMPASSTATGNVLTFVMPSEDASAEAVFVVNPLLPGMGEGNVFYGLLQPEAGTVAGNDTVGFVTGTLVPASGMFTGRVLIGGLSQAFIATIYGNGGAIFSIGSARQAALAFDGGTRSLALNFVAGRIQVRATANGGVQISSGSLGRAAYSSTNLLPSGLLNDKIPATVAVNNRAYLTVALPAKTQTPPLALESYPQGDGFGTLTLSNLGVATYAGTLADGSAFTASSGIISNGQIPFLAQLLTPGATTRGGNLSGILIVDSAQADSDVTGTNLSWYRPSVTQITLGTPAAQASQRYTSGWPAGILVDAVGALYDRTRSVQDSLGLSVANPVAGNALILLTQGKLIADVSISQLNVVASAVEKIPAINSAFSLTLVPNLGSFSGVFTPNWTSPAAPRYNPIYRGIILQKGASKGGYGYFLSNRVNDLDPESGRAILVAP